GHRPACAFQDGMQDANPDAVASEVRVRLAVKREADPPGRFASHHPLPGVVHRAAPAARLEHQAEGVGLNRPFSNRDLRCNSRPVLMPHCGVKGADDFVVAKPDVPEERRIRLEPHRKGSRAQFQRLRRGAAGVEKGFGQHGRDYCRTERAGQQNSSTGFAFVVSFVATFVARCTRLRRLPAQPPLSVEATKVPTKASTKKSTKMGSGAREPAQYQPLVMGGRRGYSFQSSAWPDLWLRRHTSGIP